MIKKDRKISLMGIVNLTDNSYYSASRFLDENGKVAIDPLLKRIDTLINEGADIIDIGACSTRPGSEPVGENEEWVRLRAALQPIQNAFPSLCLSIDTYWSSVVERSHDLIGNFLVNDISAGEDDPQMLQTVGRLGLGYIAMHKRGTPKTMQSLCNYDDVTADVLKYFKDFSIKAEEAGIKNWILDPGFGFAKTIEQNYELLRGLEIFDELGRKILVGVSRKSMIFRALGLSPEECLAPTQVVHIKALEKGADILRVHDVADAKKTVDIYRLL